MALEQELQTFKANLPELLAEHRGKYALVHGAEVVDVFPTYRDAIKAGYEQYGLTPFMVKRVLEFEYLVLVPHVVTPD